MVQQTYEQHPKNASNNRKAIIYMKNCYCQLRNVDGVTDGEKAMETEQQPPGENRMTMKRGAERSSDNHQQSPERSFRPCVQLSQLSDQEGRHASLG